ncbi:uncharacterized protein LOC112163738 [Rosa chinensis]|uniref:uncharacterized protein LOC112163738 n=1 Tax=Rosa chinensis TaxID=74649 RepID=UPI000D092CF5|nr:uncharacterized protein LOC112163738 [Rosa chinensis]
MIPFKILVWNCRGLNNTETQNALVSLVRQRNLGIIFLSETLASPDLLSDVRRNLGFDGVICSPCSDDCRGFGLFWRNEVPVRLRNYSTNHIDVEVGAIGSVGAFRFTGVYGVAIAADRMITWNLLRTLAAQVNMPWIVAGDFNEILYLDDKTGGPPRNVVQMNRFRQALVDCELMDMGFVGSRYTWSNRFTKERLDRACQNVQWRTLYPFSRVITLPLSLSDYCPLLVEVLPEPLPLSRTLKQFRFEEMWLQHTDCVNVGRKIKQTGTLLQRWHSDVFQQRQTEIKLIQGKLDDLMRKDYEVSHFDEQKALQFRLNELLSLNETYWRQRSRIQWLRDGDRNTSFFHRRASNRRCRNRVKGLLNGQGQWTSQPIELSDILINYYETIFHSDTVDSIALETILDSMKPKVTEEMNRDLVASYTDSEIRKALFQMHPSKSPGPDGMSPCFFQKFWNVVGHDVCMAVRDILLTGRNSLESNFTHLTLIPKIKEPQLPSDRRPIALCNVVYKIASKVLANRLKRILPHIVSPLQSAFVPGRLISDNTLVATENGTIKGLLMSPTAPVLHHLLFADDSFLFGEASVRECQAFKNLLSIYAQASGQMINLQNSSVVFSGNVSRQVINQLSSILGVTCVKEHGLYLGLPIHLGRNKTTIFSYLKERLSKKLISWRSKILSAGGKELLLKVVAQTLPNYVMNCYLLPKSLCDDLKQLCSQFFWGSTDGKRKIHWRSWERMCVPKEAGGLGFKHLHAHNLAMLAKQGWRLLSNLDSLVARVFKAVYHPWGSFLDADMGDRPSYSWRSIMEARPVLQAGLFWRIGNGTSMKIWENAWIPNVPSHSLEKPNDTVFEVVSDLINAQDCTWDISAVHACFPSDIVPQVLSIPLSRRVGVDKIAWKLDKRGLFSVKSAYTIARDFSIGNVFASSSNGDTYAPLWKALWKANVPNKVAIFGWRAAHNLLPTRTALTSKGYSGDLNCCVCLESVETLKHLFRDCSIAKDILGAPPFSLPSSPLTWKEWLLDRASNLSTSLFDKLLVLLWSFWKNRNEKLWKNRSQTSPGLVASSMAWYEEYMQANKPCTTTTSVQQKASKLWLAPSGEKVKLNVDGAFLPNLQFGGTGGVLHNSLGQFLAAFSSRVQFVSSPLHVELLALKKGLELLQAMHITNAVVESDCLMAVQAIYAWDCDLSPLRALVADVRSLLHSSTDFSITFAPRHANVVAHRLAALSFESEIQCEWFVTAPVIILDALMYDFNRT